MEKKEYSKPSLPDLAEMLRGVSRSEGSKYHQIGLRVTAKRNWPADLDDAIRQRIAKAADLSGTLVHIEDHSKDRNKKLTIEVQGAQTGVSSFYSKIPQIIGAVEVHHQDIEDSRYGRGLELIFKMVGQRTWTGSLTIFILRTKLASKARSGQSLHQNQKHSDIFQTSPSFEKSQALLKPSKEGSKKKCPRAWVPASLASIHELLQGGRSKESKINLKRRKMNHTQENVRFNCLIPSSLRETAAQEAGHQQASLHSEEMGQYDEVSQDPNLHSQKMKSAPKVGKYLVQVLGLDWRHIGKRELCNLFTNYGNIDSIFCLADGSATYLSYSSELGAQNAILFLNGLSICGAEIWLSKVKSEAFLDQISQKKYTTFTPKRRFSAKGSGLPNVVNHVSRTLHVTFHHNSGDKWLADEELLLVMSQYGRPVRIKRESSKKNKRKNMWFVEYLDEDTAITVIMNQHNQPYQGGTLRISFTKTL